MVEVRRSAAHGGDGGEAGKEPGVASHALVGCCFLCPLGQEGGAWPSNDWVLSGDVGRQANTEVRGRWAFLWQVPETTGRGE